MNQVKNITDEYTKGFNDYANTKSARAVDAYAEQLREVLAIEQSQPKLPPDKITPFVIAKDILRKNPLNFPFISSEIGR